MCAPWRVKSSTWATSRPGQIPNSRGTCLSLPPVTARMVLTPDLDSILKGVPQQLPEEDLPEEPRVTRVDRKDGRKGVWRYSGVWKVFQGMIFKESLQFMLPYHIVAVLSLCENWLMRDQTTGPPGAQSCCTHCTAAAAWEGGPTAAWPRPWQTMSPGWRPKPLRYEGWNFVIQD